MRLLSKHKHKMSTTSRRFASPGSGENQTFRASRHRSSAGGELPPRTFGAGLPPPGATTASKCCGRSPDKKQKTKTSVI